MFLVKPAKSGSYADGRLPVSVMRRILAGKYIAILMTNTTDQVKNQYCPTTQALYQRKYHKDNDGHHFICLASQGLMPLVLCTG
jgi:hypothetical protein